MWFSMAVANAPKHLNVKFEGVNVLEAKVLDKELKNIVIGQSIPQLYVKNEFIGGCDIVKEMLKKEN